jgi:hypothetical protein
MLTDIRAARRARLAQRRVDRARWHDEYLAEQKRLRVLSELRRLAREPVAYDHHDDDMVAEARLEPELVLE